MKKWVYCCITAAAMLLAGCKYDVESVTVNPNEITLTIGKAYQLQHIVKPDKASQEVKWVSSNAGVAIVSATGLVTAKGEGVCKIMVCADAQKDVCVVTVKAESGGSDSILVEEVTISPDTLSLTEGNSFQLTAKVLPAMAPQTITWSTSNASVAMVSSIGEVYGIKEGKCDIIAKAGGKQAVCKVNVKSDNMLTFTIGSVSFNMIKVKGGTFVMGATSEQDTDYYDNELPVHYVTLTDYCIGETEVTQELWIAVMGSGKGMYSDVNNYPANEVTYMDCETFIVKLNQLLYSQLNGKTFHLPTEAQWEYAARGGNKSNGYKYAGSNDLSQVAWYRFNSGLFPKAVAGKKPNELGIYDMSGNVWEWCSDWYGPYSSNAQVNPKGAEYDYENKDRVMRGGASSYDDRDCRVTRRGRVPYDKSSAPIQYGLRLALQ